MGEKLIFNIADYGAKGDGKNLDTAPIQQAIDACAAAGGGTVYVPPGVYVTYSLFLRDNVFLNLDQGATLMPCPKGDKSMLHGYIRCENAKNVGITGKGRIFGNGPGYWLSWEVASHAFLQEKGEIPADEQPQYFGDDRGPHEKFWPKWWYARKKYPELDGFINWPGHFISFFGCENVWLEDVFIDRQPHTAVFMVKSKNVFIRGIRIENTNVRGPNTDGISLDRCQNVMISDSSIFTGDDGIVIKGYDFPLPPDDPERDCTKNITVTNCLLNSKCNAFKIGTETCCDIENVTFSNSVIYSPTDDPFVKSGIALTCVDGAHVRGVTISNIVMKKARTPIFIRLGSRMEYGRTEVGTLRDIKIDNIVAYDALNTSFITGIPGHCIENVSLSDVRIITTGGQDASLAAMPVPENEGEYPDSTTHGDFIASYGLYSRHVKNLSVRNFEADYDETDGRHMAIFDDIEDLTLDDIGARQVSGGSDVVVLRNVRDAFVRNSKAPQGTAVFLGIEGGDSADIAVMNNVFTKAKQGVRVSGEVPEGTVYQSSNR